MALRPSFTSTYTLRGNHGWRRRFGSHLGDSGTTPEPQPAGHDALVCTAEACAALLDATGNTEGGMQLRDLLARFQREYQTRGPDAWFATGEAPPILP